MPEVEFEAGVVGDYAVRINATAPNSYIELPQTAYPNGSVGGGIEEGTITFWIKKADFYADGYQYIMGSANAGATGAAFYVRINHDPNYISVMPRGADGGNGSSWLVNEFDDAWYFVASRWESDGESRMYVGSTTENGFGDTIYGTGDYADAVAALTQPLCIGASNTAGTIVESQMLHNAAIDDIRVYNYALTDDEIADIYNNVTGGSLCVHQSDLGQFDTDGDCEITIVDFAAFAAKWLDTGLSSGL